jgi:hypothetical protein
VGFPADSFFELRESDGENFPILKTIPVDTRGIKLELGRSQCGPTTWQEISVNGFKGWVKAIYLAPDKPAVAPTTLPAVTYHVVGVQPNDLLKVRAGAGESCYAVTAIPADTRGITLGRRVRNGTTVWQEISGDGYTGWVNETYLKAD